MKHEKSIGQALWVQLDKQNVSIKEGVIYAPQENVTPVKELKCMNLSPKKYKKQENINSK